MLKPVMDLELDPRCRQQVQNSCRLEVISPKEFRADQSWVRGHEFLLGGRSRVCSGDVSSKSHANTAHLRCSQIVEQPIRMPRV